MTDAVSRARLVSRIESEARAYRNADSTTKDLRMGRVLGLLEAGAVLSYWSRRKAGGVSEAVRNGLPAWRVRRTLASRVSRTVSPHLAIEPAREDRRRSRE